MGDPRDVAQRAAIVLLAGRRCHEKWTVSRYLTEQLRTATFAVALGLDWSRSGRRPAPRHPLAPRERRHLPFYTGPRGWPADVLAEVTQKARRGFSSSAVPLNHLRDFLLKSLFAYQERWHHRNVERKESRHRMLRIAVVSLFIATLLAACMHYGHVGMPDGPEAPGSRFGVVGYWITLLAIWLPALAGALHAIDKRFEYERIATRSCEMAGMLGRYVEILPEAKSHEELRSVAAEAMELIDLEAYEWWVLLSFDAPEIAA